MLTVAFSRSWRQRIPRAVHDRACENVPPRTVPVSITSCGRRGGAIPWYQAYRHELAHASSTDPRAADEVKGARSVLTILLIILLVIALAGGGWGYGRYGAAGLSPAAIVLIILVILLLTGNFNLNL